MKVSQVLAAIGAVFGVIGLALSVANALGGPAHVTIDGAPRVLATPSAELDVAETASSGDAAEARTFSMKHDATRWLVIGRAPAFVVFMSENGGSWHAVATAGDAKPLPDTRVAVEVKP